MGDKGSILIKERNVERHRMFEQQLFDRTDGDWSIRIVLSGYTFMENGAQGTLGGIRVYRKIFTELPLYSDYSVNSGYLLCLIAKIGTEVISI
jgi:hypothetical protein